MGWIFILIFMAGSRLGTASEKFESPVHGFTIEAPEGWTARQVLHDEMVFSFADPNSFATMHGLVRDTSPGMTTEELQWENLFDPHFDVIDVRLAGIVQIDRLPAKYCIYAILPGEVKKQLEGKQHFRYLNYVMVKDQKLYSITFTDEEPSFNMHYPEFLKSIRSMKFMRET